MCMSSPPPPPPPPPTPPPPPPAPSPVAQTATTKGSLTSNDNKSLKTGKKDGKSGLKIKRKTMGGTGSTGSGIAV